MNLTRDALTARIKSLMTRAHHEVSDDDVCALALDVWRWQRAACPVIDRIAEAMLDGREPLHIDDVPAVPTDVFKTSRVACFAPEQTVRTFLTSGTTQEHRGVHGFDDLSLYDLALEGAARRWLLPRPRYCFVLLAADEREAPESSLSYMLARFAERWGDRDEAFCVRAAEIDVERVRARIDAAWRVGLPVALLGASYGFVHLADALGHGSLGLPADSVVMPTGGFKGRSREIDPVDFRAMVRARFDVAATQVVGEYGMTELSSQAYEAHLEGTQRFRAPPWMRVSAVDPVTLRRVGEGELGLLRVIDLANLGSSIALQTSDLGRVSRDGFEVLGRAPDATPRGCARALDAALLGES
jgi:hypothetical protein